ncbi:TerB family tellurite resistance protein [Flavobacterium sp. S87F.05.LMB.W.Kidney.N]|uniref:TerB family tellurite resistance protein n=1 Tax=Flavobacterium sp. S87F.05.LMB.W.Kidney.N TaxID=1278758 RepID=UPI0010653236|nr:excinuclease ABC subunit B [Flavobacterium sp. S87F.05.LMB.W.Kidney.N]TDX11355.1 tellurite resistance protein TerB [Flavobacterium sp. S87F.05.LMB.W.Kidney.N]
MNTEAEKRSLLLEMIMFATVDGHLHKRELEFLRLVALELSISEEEFQDLFHQETKTIPIKSEMQRINQFYRLALLMHCDGVLHEREFKAIQQIALEMGLNPSAVKRVLEMMKKAPKTVINPTVVLQVFQEQHN